MNTKQRTVTMLLVFAFFAVAASSSLAASPCPNQDRPALNGGDSRWRLSLLCLVNKERSVRHLHTLKWNSRLGSGAQNYAAQMVQQHFFAHVSPAGIELESRIRATGYLRHMSLMGLGENIYATGMPTQTPSQAMTAWMGSQHHRANLLDPSWRDFGSGIVRYMPSTPQGWTMTQWFAARQK